MNSRRFAGKEWWPKPAGRGMILAGTLKRPIDIVDLRWHAWPFLLLAVRVVMDIVR